MKRKHLILLVVAILAVALLISLVLVRCGRPQSTPGGENTTPATKPSSSATDPSSSATDPSSSSTEPSSSATDPSSPEPSEPTAPAVWPTSGPIDPPEHTHTFQKGQTVPATQEHYGYTLYICSQCGYAYEGDLVAALTVQDLINAQPLNPTVTGIPALDTLVKQTLNRIVPENASSYDKLKAIFDYQCSTLTHSNVIIDAEQALAFSPDKCFANAGELLICYEAYQALTGSAGVSDHYAAAFAVLTRAVGFESYVVSGTRDGVNHVWNCVRIDGTLYTFDAYEIPQFAKTDDALPGYHPWDREGYLARQTGFQEAEAFSVTLTVGDGTRTLNFVFDMEQIQSGEPLTNTVTVEASGGYTLTASGNVRLTDEFGDQHDDNTITGYLDPGVTVLVAQDRSSLRKIVIQVKNESAF